MKFSTEDVLQRDSNPWHPRHRCDARPTELWSHTFGARSVCWVHIFPWSEMMWNIYEIHIVLRLKKLRWSFFTFIYKHSTIWISYTFHNFGFCFSFFAFCFSLFMHYACHTVVRFCCEGLQGTFPARADSLRPSELQDIFASGTWFLSATKAKKSLLKLNEIFLLIKST